MKQFEVQPKTYTQTNYNCTQIITLTLLSIVSFPVSSLPLIMGPPFTSVENSIALFWLISFSLGLLSLFLFIIFEEYKNKKAYTLHKCFWKTITFLLTLITPYIWLDLPADKMTLATIMYLCPLVLLLITLAPISIYRYIMYDKI